MFEKLGIGIDIVSVTRFEKMPFEKHKNFYKKIFLDSEITYCLNKKNRYQSFAAKFAIKEAVIKSINKSISFKKIVTGHSNSHPTVRLLNNSLYDFLVSVSHEEKYAVAVVISYNQ